MTNRDLPNRREFVAHQAAWPLGLAALPSGWHRWLNAGTESPIRIERIEIYPVRYPMTGYFKFFAGPDGQTGRAAVIIKITAADGTVGWGESVPLRTWSNETLETAVIALDRFLIPALIGHDARDIAGAHQLLDQTIAPSFSTAMPITRAGLDLALHDLVGRVSGRDLHELWERPRGNPLTLSWTVNVRNLDETEAVVQSGRHRGYQNFNIKIAPHVDFDVQLAKRVRELAPDCFLWADANCGYDVESALKAAPRLADAGVNVWEAPIRPNKISGYQALKRQAALPLFMDEGVVAPVELAEFIRLGMLDGVAQKPARCGGLLSCRQQIELLQKHNLAFLGSGLTDPDISLAACIKLYAAYGLTRPAALNGPQFITTSVLNKRISDAGGKLQIPTGPGLGIDVNEQKVIELSQVTFQPDRAAR